VTGSSRTAARSLKHLWHLAETVTLDHNSSTPLSPFFPFCLSQPRSEPENIVVLVFLTTITDEQETRLFHNTSHLASILVCITSFYQPRKASWPLSDFPSSSLTVETGPWCASHTPHSSCFPKAVLLEITTCKKPRLNENKRLCQRRHDSRHVTSHAFAVHTE
jgi:hypothetical protein